MIAFAVLAESEPGALSPKATWRVFDAMRSFSGRAPHRQVLRSAAFFAQTVFAEAGQGGERPPFYAPGDGSLVVGDVRLDRLSAFRCEAGLNGGDSSGSASTRHLRALWWAYRRAGKHVFANLSGSFAFVMWDARVQQLIAVRDGMGEVPLYWTEVAGAYAISNHLPVLLRSLEEQPDLSFAPLLRRIVGIYPRGTATEYRQIERIAAGHVWELTTGRRPQSYRYWSLRAAQASAPATFEESAQVLRETLEASVRDRIPAAGPVGVELSGGLDSSSVSGIVAHYAGDRTRSYSAVFPGVARSDEEEYIRSAARHQNIHNSRFSALELDWAASFDASLDASGLLIIAANLHVPEHIYRLAKADGCLVVFNGIDGDNVASHGYCRLAELARAGRWAEFAKQVRRVEDLFGTPGVAVRRALYDRYGRPALRDRFRQRSILDFGLVIAVMQLRLRLGLGIRSLVAGVARRPMSRSASLPKGWFHPEFLNDAEWQRFEQERLEDRVAHASEREAMLGVLEGVSELYFEFSYPLAARAGLRIAAPFMDREVLRLGVNTPSEFKLRGDWNRAFMREGLARYMGERVAWRRWKSDLGFGIAPHFSRAILPRLRELLDHRSDSLWTVFSHSRVEMAATQLSAAIANGSDANRRQLHLILAAYAFHRFTEIGRGMLLDRG